MGVISTDKNEIKLYFNSENSIGKQIQAYVMASERKLLAIDVSKTKVTGTQWTELAKGVGLPISSLIDQRHPDFVKNYGDHPDLDNDEWLKILDKKPIVLTTAIAIIGEHFVQLHSRS